MAVLTATQIRDRISIGSPPLSSEFTDAWIEETRDVFMEALAEDKRVHYESTEVVETVRAAGCTNRLVLRWPLVTAIESVEVDGDALDVTFQFVDGVPYLTEGSIPAGAFAVVTYTAGPATTPPAVLQAVALFVERSATANRSSSSRDAWKEGFDGGSSTVYLRAGNGNLTAFSDVNDLVANLPSYRTPGVA